MIAYTDVMRVDAGRLDALASTRVVTTAHRMLRTMMLIIHKPRTTARRDPRQVTMGTLRRPSAIGREVAQDDDPEGRAAGPRWSRSRGGAGDHDLAQERGTI